VCVGVSGGARVRALFGRVAYITAVNQQTRNVWGSE
jgi:hypothetical protein